MMEQTYIGRYRVVDQVGSGGMGTVLRAVDEGQGREVAIKLPNERNPEALQRLRQECDVDMRLQHHHIVEVYGSGSTTETPFYMVMEFVQGQSLDQVLRERGGRLDPRQALKIASGVAEALAYAHQPPLRIIHRDIKPGNVLLRAHDGAVKVTDFGIAAVLSEQSGRTAIGTLAYMSPEQALGHGVDERSDLYSLGALLYEMLTGQLPPRLASAAPKPPSLWLGSMPPAISQRIDWLVLGLLAGDRNQRQPQQAREVAEELKALLENRPTRPVSGAQPGYPIHFAPTQQGPLPPAANNYPLSSGPLPNNMPAAFFPAQAHQLQPLSAGAAKPRTSKLAKLAVGAAIVPYIAVAAIVLLNLLESTHGGSSGGCDGQGNCYSTGPSPLVLLVPALTQLLSIPGFVGMICAIACGHQARSSIRRSGGWLRGKGLATAALVLGYGCLIGALGWTGFLILHYTILR